MIASSTTLKHFIDKFSSRIHFKEGKFRSVSLSLNKFFPEGNHHRGQIRLVE